MKRRTILSLAVLGSSLLLALLFQGSAAGQTTVPFYAQNPAAPNVLIILDRSGSMSGQPAGGSGFYCSTNPWGTGCANESKISIAVRVLADLLDDNNNLAVDNVNDPTGLGLRLGYAHFLSVPGTTGGAYGAGEGAAPQYANGTIRVIRDVGSNYTDIFTSVNSKTVSGYTPNGTALMEALSYFQTAPAVISAGIDPVRHCRRPYVIIVTDGMDTKTCVAGSENVQNRRAMVFAARQLRNMPMPSYWGDPATWQGVPVYVVGVGNLPTQDQSVLSWTAYYGGTDNPSVTNGPALVDAYTSGSGSGSGGTVTPAVGAPAALCSSGTDPETNALTGYAFIATSAAGLTTALKTAIAQIKSGSYTRSAPVVTQQGDRVYVGFYDLPYWKGHLEAFSVNSSGVVDFSSALFDAGANMASGGTPGTRGTVYTANAATVAGTQCVPQAGSPVAFADTTAVLTTGTCQATLHGGIDINGSGGAANAADAQTVINFTLNPQYGAASAPYPYVGVRDSTTSAWKLGDIFHSTPAVVGPPGENYTFDNYSSFKTDNAGRTTMVYVGGNDGMLHAINASTGVEQWAYVPNAVLGSLRDLRIDHKYLADGTPVVADVCVGSSPCTWKTVLVSGLRDGGNKYFAIDVTNPTSPQVLWETGHGKMGNTWSRPAIGRVAAPGNSFKWVAFAGGGINPSSGDPKIFAIDISDGSIYYGGTGTQGDVTDYTGAKDPSGITNAVMGAVKAVGKGYGLVDTVYFGDLEGKLWRLDVSKDNTSQWKLDVLYDPFDPANDTIGYGTSANPTRRPIYNAPSIALIKSSTGSNYYIAFGTGSESDTSSGLGGSVQNYFFLVKDPNAVGATTVTPAGASDRVWRTGEKGVTAMVTDEKNVGDPVIYFGYVYFSTYTPSTDPCLVGSSDIWKVPFYDPSGSYSAMVKYSTGQGLPTGPVIIPSTTGGPANLLGFTSVNPIGGATQTSVPGPANPVRVESWREQF